MIDIATITLILQVVTILGGVIVYFFLVKNDVNLLKKDIEQIKKDTGKINGEVGILKEKVGKIEGYITRLSNYLDDGGFGKLEVPTDLKKFNLYASNSPLRLNEAGINFIKNSGFDKVVDEYKGRLIDEVKRKVQNVDEDKKLYYIEKESFNLIKELDSNNDKIMEGVGLYIFDNGLLDGKSIILNALGIYLRDRVVEDLGLTEKMEKLFKK